MRPKQHKSKPKRQLIGGRLVYPQGMPKPKLIGGRLMTPQVMPMTIRGPLPVAVPIQSTNLTTQVQRDMGQGLSNMSAQDRINMAFKNLRLGQTGRGVRML
jgi:hypothetical protein